MISMNDTPIWRTLAQADTEEITAIRLRALEVLTPFLNDAPSVMGLSQAICELWPMLYIEVEGLAKGEQQRTKQEQHTETILNWRKVAKTTMGIDLSHPPKDTKLGFDLP